MTTPDDSFPSLSDLAAPDGLAPRPALGDRSGFSRLTAASYLAHAAVAPLADGVLGAMKAELDAAAGEGIGVMERLGAWLEVARERFARLIGAPKDAIALVPSTSAGVSAIATALRFVPGERVLCFDGEFPTNVAPWQAAARGGGARVDLVPLAPFARSHAEGLDAVREQLERGKPDNGQVRVVAVSAVQFQTGLAMPIAALAELAHAHGALLFVDAIQAAGAVPIDVEASGVDFLAAAGHKWLMGPLGEAYLFVSPRVRERLEPVQVGWLGIEDAFVFLGEPDRLRYDRPFATDARVFEQGVVPFANYAGSAVALESLERLGVGAIFEHANAWLDALEPQLTEAGWTSVRPRERAARSAIASFAPPAGVEVAAVVEAAARRRVVVTGPDGHLRIAPHWPNAREEVELAARVLIEATREVAGA